MRQPHPPALPALRQAPPSMRRTIRIIGFAAVFAALGAAAAHSQQPILAEPASGGGQAAHAPSTACTALFGSLTPAAGAVWRRLCAGEAVDLSKIPDAGRGTFLDEIIADPSRQAMLKDARIRMANGSLDALTIDGLEARSLTLQNIAIRERLALYDSVVGDAVALDNVRVGGDIDIENLTARRFSQSASRVTNPQNSLSVRDSRLDKLSIDRSDDPQLNIFDSQIGAVDISKLGNTNIKLWSLGGGEINILNSGKLTISASELATTGSIRLLNDLWEDDAAKDTPPVVLSYVQAPEFVLFSGFAGFRPPRLGVEHAKFDAVSFGPDPLPAIAGIGAIGAPGQTADNPQYLPFLAAAARTYAANGRADLAQEITYKINLLNKPPLISASDIWSRGFWLLRWIAVGFGQRVEWGIYWIILLVAIGWLVFRTGRKFLVDPSTRPGSWLLFAIDSVIPVIHLDRRHDEVAFNGWRQWYLGFLRIMGAVLVFLVFYFLKQVLLGGE